MSTRFDYLGLSGRLSDDTNLLDSKKSILEIPLPVVAAATAQDTSVTIPANSIVNYATVYIKTAEATGSNKAVSVGISGGSGTAFVNTASVASTGIASGESGVAADDVTVSYTLGSDDFAELDAYAIIEIITIDNSAV